MSIETPAEQRVPPRDVLGRPLGSLRISVVDRCDLRCAYCMPEKDYIWLPRQSILSFEEIDAIACAFTRLGTRKVRLTGGEPLLRNNLVELVRLLAQNPQVEDLALTTNATQLERWATPLLRAGLHRITVSLDSLQPDRFAALTRRDALDKVLVGIRAAAGAGFKELKINTVVMRGFNEDELIPLVEFGKEVGAQVRFIEYMDVGGATSWAMGKVFSRSEILARLEAYYGSLQVDGAQGAAPAQRLLLPDGTRVGIIASVTEPFCRTCDRSRITADGMWYPCLYAHEGMDLKEVLRGGGSIDDLVALIRSAWLERDDRGAEERLVSPDRKVLYQVEELKADPRREMHTRGG